MARKSTPKPTARDLALAVRQGERQGKTQREIGAALGINERTVRKIKSGETSGTRTTERLRRRPLRPGATPNAMNAEFVMGYDANGQPVLASANIIVTDVRTRHGTRRAPTALDVFRMPNLANVADAERKRMMRQYASIVTTPAPTDSPVRLRSISTMRRPAAAIIRTGL